MAQNNRRSKTKSKRSFRPAPTLEPTSLELEKVRTGLTEFYKANPQFLKNQTIDEKIDEVIEKAKVGWSCASKNFIKRVELLTKWNSAAIKQVFGAQNNYHNAAQVRIAEEIKEAEEDLTPGLDAESLRGMLTGKEKKVWVQREKKYRTEFEFNDSSDWPLLLQVLTEEIHQLRLVERRLKHNEADLDIELNESYKRMNAALKALGLTREQRESATKETDGNIAQLVKQFEEKERFIEKRKELDRLEEDALQAKHDADGELDILESLGLKEMADQLRQAKATENIPDTNTLTDDEIDKLESDIDGEKS